MRVPSAIFWGVLAILFLLVAGTMIYQIYVLSKLEGGSSNTLFAPTVAGLALTSAALLGLLTAFVGYTATTYNDGNWLKTLVNGSQAKYERAVERVSAAKADLEATRKRISDLSRIAMNPAQQQRMLEDLRQREKIAQTELNQAKLQAQKAPLPPPIAVDGSKVLPPPSGKAGSLPPPPAPIARPNKYFALPKDQRTAGALLGTSSETSSSEDKS